jgi:hypothetical protein
MPVCTMHFNINIRILLVWCVCGEVVAISKYDLDERHALKFRTRQCSYLFYRSHENRYFNYWYIPIYLRLNKAQNFCEHCLSDHIQHCIVRVTDVIQITGTRNLEIFAARYLHHTFPFSGCVMNSYAELIDTRLIVSLLQIFKFCQYCY